MEQDEHHLLSEKNQRSLTPLILVSEFPDWNTGQSRFANAARNDMLQDLRLAPFR
jgi:hypothetical protein